MKRCDTISCHLWRVSSLRHQPAVWTANRSGAPTPVSLLFTANASRNGRPCNLSIRNIRKNLMAYIAQRGTRPHSLLWWHHTWMNCKRNSRCRCTAEPCWAGCKLAINVRRRDERVSAVQQSEESDPVAKQCADMKLVCANIRSGSVREAAGCDSSGSVYMDLSLWVLVLPRVLNLVSNHVELQIL